LTITLWKYRLYFFYLYLSYGFALARSISGLAKLEKMRLHESQFLWKLNGVVFQSVYYYYRIDAIIPTMIIISLSSFLFAFYFSKK
jgi:PST family polysaccharide transporter